MNFHHADLRRAVANMASIVRTSSPKDLSTWPRPLDLKSLIECRDALTKIIEKVEKANEH